MKLELTTKATKATKAAKATKATKATQGWVAEPWGVMDLLRCSVMAKSVPLATLELRTSQDISGLGPD